MLAVTGTASAAAPTFYRDVLPLLAAKCQTCHRPGEAAPMPLLTYAQTRPWAKAIRESVATRRMPPWHADNTVARYSNDLSLTNEQRAVFTAWVDAGAPEGNAADAPKPKPFTDGWRIAKPDVVFSLPEPYEVPAKGTIDYQYFTVSTHFTEDRWIEMAEVRPTARRVVHHAIVTVRAPDERGWYGGQFLAGYAPGAAPQIWKPGVARLIPAGSELIFQMHYTASGKTVTDRTQVGLVFAKHPPRERAVAMRAVNTWFAIPPGEANHKVEAVASIREPLKLAAIRPHMHLRGKAFEVKAVLPDGTSRMVLKVPRYDFHWQPYYYLETPLSLPAGARLECTAWYDNSANNPRNPAPEETVRWGEQSWEEMMIGWFDVLLPAGEHLTSATRR
ncbi:MAG: thiol-disulfide isomerase [Bryobacterales bacterium]|nr:thiol-disulfide isomerase [Bryobacterales bacterium]